jgi:hypothetical protein
MAGFTYFRNRIDALAGRVAVIVEDLTERLDQGDLGDVSEQPPSPRAEQPRPAARSAAG